MAVQRDELGQDNLEENTMSIFTVDENRDPIADMAKGFLKEANQQAEVTINNIYDAVDRFWYRNRDSEGERSPSRHDADGDYAGSQEPTGPEMLTAMGPAAGAFLALAWARVEMVLAMQTALGRNDLVDMAKILPPYDLEWNPDGSLKTATLKS